MGSRRRWTTAYCDLCYRDIGDLHWLVGRLFRVGNRDACRDCYNEFQQFLANRMAWGREQQAKSGT